MMLRFDLKMLNLSPTVAAEFCICSSATGVPAAKILVFHAHRCTIQNDSDVISFYIYICMSADFRRHLVGKTLKMFYSAVNEIRFVGRLMIMWTFS